MLLYYYRISISGTTVLLVASQRLNARSAILVWECYRRPTGDSALDALSRDSTQFRHQTYTVSRNKWITIFQTNDFILKTSDDIKMRHTTLNRLACEFHS